MVKRKIEIFDTTLRDTHQSIKGTQLRTDELMPIAELINDIGFDGAEVWGGSTFDTCLRYFHEDPWDRLKKFRKILTNIPIRVLIRGQNIFGYKHYSDDILEKFLENIKSYNVDIIRTYDPLNDTRNIQKSIEISKCLGMKVESALIYYKNPLCDSEALISKAKEMKEFGADLICLKDMTSTLSPKTAHTIVYRIKKEVGIPVSMHCHSPGGIAAISYVFGIMAGASSIDCASSPLAIYSNQPSVEAIMSILDSTRYMTEVSKEKVIELAKYASTVALKHMGDIKERTILNINTILYGLPTGMLSSIIAHLERQGYLNKIEDVINEIKVIEKEIGYPPLIAPISHIVGLQAVSNILTGERYKVVPKEIKWYLRGWYGRTPGNISRKVIDKIFSGEEKYDPIECRPADKLKEKYQSIKKEIKSDLIKKDEDYLTYALFPSAALRYFKYRENPEDFKDQYNDDLLVDPFTESLLTVDKLSKWMHENRVLELSIKENDKRVYIDRRENAVSEASMLSNPVSTPALTAKPEKKVVENYIIIKSPMAGVFYSAPSPGSEPFVKEGKSVTKDTTLCIIEAMKLFNEIKSECSGTVVKILVKNEDPISVGQELFYIK